MSSATYSEIIEIAHEDKLPNNYQQSRHIFVTDRNSGISFLVDIGTGLCVYPRKKLRGSANKDEYSKIKMLGLFSIIFDNKLWEILVTETNRFAYQTMHDERKRRKVDDAWYPITLDEIKAYYALCMLRLEAYHRPYS